LRALLETIATAPIATPAATSPPPAAALAILLALLIPLDASGASGMRLSGGCSLLREFFRVVFSVLDPILRGRLLGEWRLLLVPFAAASTPAPSPSPPATTPGLAGFIGSLRGELFVDLVRGRLRLGLFCLHPRRDRVGRNALRGGRGRRPRRRATVDGKVLLPGKRRVRLDQDVHAETLLKLAQMRTLLVEEIESNLRFGPHDEVVCGAAQQLLFQGAQ
jgi:hypothetical protein